MSLRRISVLAMAMLAQVHHTLGQNTGNECTWTMTLQKDVATGQPMTCVQGFELNVVDVNNGIGAYYEANCVGIGCGAVDGECRLCVFNRGRYKLANNNADAAYVDCPCCVSETLDQSSDTTGCEASGPDMLNKVNVEQCSTAPTSCTSSITNADKEAGIGAYVDYGCYADALVGCNYNPNLAVAEDSAKCRQCVFDWTLYEANLQTANPIYVGGGADQHPVQCPCCVTAAYGIADETMGCLPKATEAPVVKTAAPVKHTAAPVVRTTAPVKSTEAPLDQETTAPIATANAGADFQTYTMTDSAADAQTQGDNKDGNNGDPAFMADWSSTQKVLFGAGIGVMFWVAMAVVIGLVFKHVNKNVSYHKAGAVKCIDVVENPVYEVVSSGNEEAKQHNV